MLASLERAREAERRFVADASHELRTPLTALRGNAAYIAQHGAERRRAGRPRGATPARLAHLLDDLLALAREDAAGPAPPTPVASTSSRSSRAGRARRGRRARPGHRARRRGGARARHRQPGRERARARPGREPVTIDVREAGGPRARDRARPRPGAERDEAEHAFERFWRARRRRRARRARVSASRSCAPRRSATAAASRSTARRSRSTCRSADLSETSQADGYTSVRRP